MIAHIIPVRRLPQQLGIFDYQIPLELQERIQPGQLVTIPIRTSQSFGIVLSIDETVSSAFADKIKPITDIVHDTPLLSKPQLHIARILHKWYGISIATMIKMMLLPMQKRKITKASFLPLPAFKKSAQIPPSTFNLYTSQELHQKELTKHINNKKQTLILVPEVYLIDEVVDFLNKSDANIVTWHSGLSVKEQFDHWCQIRNGEASIIVGTRSAVLLPFFDLGSIIVDYEHNEQHKHWDQAPRFHAKDIADLLHQIYGTTYHQMSFTYSVETFASLPNTLKTLSLDTKKQPTFVDIRSERADHNYGVFSHVVERAIEEVQGDMFFFLNRRGYATSLGCRACGFTFRCHQCQLPFIYHEHDNSLKCHYCNTRGKIEFICPECTSPMIRLSGAGTELVDKTIRKMLGGKSKYKVIRIDGDGSSNPVEDLDPHVPRVIVGTLRALPYIRWEHTDLITFISVDQQLSLPEYTAEEEVWQLIQEVQFRRKDDSKFFIQTMNPDQAVFQALQNPESLYTTNLTLRKAFHYPPHTFLVRYMFTHTNQTICRQTAQNVYNRLTTVLTKQRPSITLSGPVEMHPSYYRGKYWYAIMARIPVESWKNDLLWLNAHIPHGWKIDPHPISILSP